MAQLKFTESMFPSNERENAIKELIDSETQYNTLLGLLINFYVLPLKDSKIINNDQYNILFPQIHSIKELSDNFLNDLKNANDCKLSNLFNEICPWFKLYQDLVNNHEKAIILIKELKQNKKWNMHCQRALLQTQRIPLQNLLVLPTEQLLRYDDILPKILKHTAMNDPDYMDLSQSYESFKNVVEQINAKMIDFDRRENVRRIEQKFKEKITLLQPHRSFICEGKLWKISNHKSTKDRLYQFFLFNDLLIYASSYGQKYKIHNMLPINSKFKAKMLKNKQQKYGKDKSNRIFSIFSDTKSFVVYADTSNLANEWVKQLNLQCAAHNRPERRMSRQARKLSISSRFSNHEKKKSAQQLPIWQPDSNVSECPICGQKFKLTNRKHHCRRCGQIVCAKCSKYKLENNENVKQRACATCYFAECGGFNSLQLESPTPRLSLRSHQSDKSFVERKRSESLHSVKSSFSMNNRGSEHSDDSYASDYENEIQTLFRLSYYVETIDFEDIFYKFGRGMGSYLLIPGIMNGDNLYYTVNLVILCENEKFQIFKIMLLEKKTMIFRLEKKSLKTKDFKSMNELLAYLEQKERIKFLYPIQRNRVESKSHHKINSIVFSGNLSEQYSVSVNYPKAKALYDYNQQQQQNDDNFMTLSFKKGDFIFITDMMHESNGWWQGQIGDKKGIFPSNYVQIIGDNEEEKVNENEKNDDECKENVDEYGNNLDKMKSNGPMMQFYKILSSLRMEKYFGNFQNYECSDVALIDCFTDDADAEDLLKNDVGIKNKIHRKKLIKAFKDFEVQMNAFKNNEFIPSFLISKLAKYGIVTMDILCVEIEQKSDLMNKVKIQNQSQCELLWNIIQNQRQPKKKERKRPRNQTLSPKVKEVEGFNEMNSTPPPPIPKVPKDDEDKDEDFIVTTKGGDDDDGQPGHRSLFSKDVDDIDVGGSPVPVLPPPIPPVPKDDDDDDAVVDPYID